MDMHNVQLWYGFKSSIIVIIILIFDNSFSLCIIIFINFYYIHSFHTVSK